VVTIEEYRKLLNDNRSTDEQIKKRLVYLEAFCRNIITAEIVNYTNKKRNEQTK